MRVEEQECKGTGKQEASVKRYLATTVRSTQYAICNTQYAIIALSLVLLAAWLRLWQLNSTPPGLWFDEAYNGMDAAWMLETKTWPVFLLGNHGREAMFHYLLALSMTVFGDAIYVIRLVSVLLAILSIPMMYRWVLTIFQGEADAYWLAIVSTAGLATSFWYLAMNRAAYRANLFPLFILFVSYFFWRGWQTEKISYYLVSGIGLGLCQYTYLSARLFPLVFVLFISFQTLLFWQKERARLKTAWLGLCVMGVVSVLVSAPLLTFFINNPGAAWGRVSDVALKAGCSTEGLKTLGVHLGEAVRIFIDGEDPNWRHHLLGRPGFDCFNTVGFWLGLLIAVRQYRRPANLFLLVLLFVMWLPAPLSQPAFHTLRLSGILPPYYVLVAIGLVSVAGWVGGRLLGRLAGWQVGLAALGVLLLLSGGLTFYDYFYRWAKLREVYEAYDGHVVDLARHLVSLDSEANLIIPFYLYTHASMRYLLNDSFKEEVLLPEDVLANLNRQKTVSLVIPEYPPDDGKPPAFVWLIKAGPGPGVAYVSEVRRDATLTGLKSGTFMGSRDNIIAYQYDLETQDVLPLFPQQTAQKRISVEWADNLRLVGYEFKPPLIKTGAANTLHLVWVILGQTGLKEKIFIQLLNSRATPVGQAEVEPISRKMYRWRNDGLILEQHPLNLDANLETGLYFVRLGFFNPATNRRLQAYGPAKQSLGDEIILGPLYVGNGTADLTTPQYPTQAMLGQAIEVLGYSLYPAEDASLIYITLYWKTHRLVDKNYTAFVQVLNAQNEVVAQHDSQPLNGFYPTSRWQLGDIVVDKFVLPVSSEALSGDSNRLVTGMYDLSTGVRLPAYSRTGELLPDGLVQLVD